MLKNARLWQPWKSPLQRHSQQSSRAPAGDFPPQGIFSVSRTGRNHRQRIPFPSKRRTDDALPRHLLRPRQCVDFRENHERRHILESKPFQERLIVCGDVAADVQEENQELQVIPSRQVLFDQRAPVLPKVPGNPGESIPG